MLTAASDLRDHLNHMRRAARCDRLTGQKPKMWPTPNYVRMLEIRLERAEQREGRAA